MDCTANRQAIFQSAGMSFFKIAQSTHEWQKIQSRNKCVLTYLACPLLHKSNFIFGGGEGGWCPIFFSFIYGLLKIAKQKMYAKHSSLSFKFFLKKLVDLKNKNLY